ncbi:MAG: class I SAM-dependent RNA methyltransferase [Lachnospiraceae bacterium]|nr:class I SAM-dependent RNA methyltransferase [Lachnospiraceae bacterium]
MRAMELMTPCHFGMEAVAKREIYDLGYEVTKTEDGRVYFAGDAEAVVLANLCLRTVERVLIHIGSFEARTFDELFEGIRALPWEEYIPEDGRFWVTKASSVKSALFSTPDIQSIAKKAMVERLKETYPVTRFAEDGADFPVRISLNKDRVTVGLDTTGASLHKRGYRPASGEAPISETLAAALISLTPWKRDRILVDPFCGSGTFLIEAAMMARQIAPGLDRHFTAESWETLCPKELWKDAQADLRGQIQNDAECDLQGYDIDGRVLALARENAGRAGVGDLIHFQQRDVAKLSHPKPYGFIVTNPPYGERMGEDDDLYGIYRSLGEAYRGLQDWSMYVITSYEDAQRAIGRKADKNRKVYNGMLRAYYYQYLGAKPKWKKRS